MQIRIAPDPQLVVCKGNVADRVQKLKTGQSVLSWRCCRASYGTMCKILHNPKDPAQFGLRTELDQLDGKVYVANCIDWFVKQVSHEQRKPHAQIIHKSFQGEPVSSDHPIVRKFSRKCPPADAQNPNPTRVFPTDVVCTEVERSQLPIVFNACKSPCYVSPRKPSTKLIVISLSKNLQSRIRLLRLSPHNFQAEESTLVEQRQKVPPHQDHFKSWVRLVCKPFGFDRVDRSGSSRCPYCAKHARDLQGMWKNSSSFIDLFAS